MLAQSEDGGKGLKRTLGAGNLVALGVGAIIGAGLFVRTAAAAGQAAGPGVTLSFIVAAVGCAFASENEWLNLFIIFSFISVAGILGNYVGYQIGNKVGPAMYDWKENLFFKKKYLSQAQDFYEKHGGRAIVIARFIPIVRTFAPIVAGIVKMDKSKFTYFNIVGCLAWVASMLCAGHFLQSYIYNHFQFDLKKHLEIIVLVIVFVTTAPVIFQVIKHRTKK